MRAMQVTELGQPLRMQELPKPTAAEGEVIVKVHTCGLNFGDLLAIKGTSGATGIALHAGHGIVRHRDRRRPGR